MSNEDTTEPAPTSPEPAADRAEADPPFLTRVVVTGASGFVGRWVVRELVARGHKPVCLVRHHPDMQAHVSMISRDRYEIIVGDFLNGDDIRAAVEGAEAVVHLVGIIAERRLSGDTFERVHVEGTRGVVEAAASAGVRRIAHMSALGSRYGAASRYHRTKWAAENIIRESGLDWTIFRPSIIHGPDGEFMRMMRVFACELTVNAFGFLPVPFPVMPYFGSGENRLQPVSVRDVAEVFVRALSLPETVGCAYDLGGPEAMSWKELYRTCQALIPGSRRKPLVGQPVAVARLMARTLMKLPILPRMLRFNEGQVQMSQEDSVCDIVPVEKAFDIKLRDFRAELAAYAAQIQA